MAPCSEARKKERCATVILARMLGKQIVFQSSVIHITDESVDKETFAVDSVKVGSESLKAGEHQRNLGNRKDRKRAQGAEK